MGTGGKLPVPFFLGRSVDLGSLFLECLILRRRINVRAPLANFFELSERLGISGLVEIHFTDPFAVAHGFDESAEFLAELDGIVDCNDLELR